MWVTAEKYPRYLRREYQETLKGKYLHIHKWARKSK
jgi:hypothetical protein